MLRKTTLSVDPPGAVGQTLYSLMSRFLGERNGPVRTNRSPRHLIDPVLYRTLTKNDNQCSLPPITCSVATAGGELKVELGVTSVAVGSSPSGVDVSSAGTLAGASKVV